jgi:TP901 family phage tail tape measure protein
MSDASRVVELVFQGVDQTGSAVNSVLSGTQKLTGGVKDLTQPMADLTISAAKLEGAMIATGVAITGLAVKVAGDFDSAFREISTLIDEPVEGLDGFRQSIRDYAVDSTQSLEQVTGAVYNAISAGVDYTDSLSAVRQAEELAVAGKADLDSTLKVLVSSLNAYGASMDEAESYSDALFLTVKQGQTTLPELADSLAAVTSLAATAGVAFPELLSAVAALTKAGTPTSEAITSIRAALSSIIKPSSQAAKLAAELGVEFNASALASKGFAGLLEDVRGATGGNVEQMALLFGSVEGLGAVLDLTGNAAGSFAENLAKMDDRAGTTAVAFDKMAGDIGNANQKIVNAAKDLLIEVGTPLLDAYGGISEAIAAIFKAIGQELSGGELKQFSVLLEGMMDDLLAVFQNVAKNLPEALAAADLSGFRNGIEVVRDAIKGLFDGADLTTAEGLASVIEGLGTSFNLFQTFIAGAIDTLPPFIAALGNIGEILLSIDPKFAELLGTIGGFSLIINKVVGSLDTLLLALIAFGGSKGAVTVAAGAVKGLVTVLTGPVGLTLAFIGLMTQIGKVNEAIANFGGDNSIQNWANRIVTDMAAVDQAFERQEQRLKDSERQHEETLSNIADMMQEFREMGGGPETDLDLAEQADALSESFRQAGMHYNSATGEVSKLSDLITKTIDVQDAAADSGRQWVKTIGEDGIPVFEQVGKSFTDEITDPAKKGLDEATQKTEDFLLELEKIASNERIRGMELSVDLNIAQIEADTARIESAFESINTTISSTGDVISSLWGNMGDLSAYDQLGLERQIRKENEAREKAFELQKRMTEAQIREMDARTKRMQQGDAMIKIEGDGLQPHLEAFMWEILRAIQVRVNADGLDMLTGV